MLFKLGKDEKGNEFLDDAILCCEDKESDIKVEGAEEYAIGAHQLYQLHKYADAEDMLRKCIRIIKSTNDRDNNALLLASKHHDLGMILLAAGELEDAEIELNHAIRIKNQILEKAVGTLILKSSIRSTQHG